LTITRNGTATINQEEKRGKAKLPYHVVSAALFGEQASSGSQLLGSVDHTCTDDSSYCTFQWKNPSRDKKYSGRLRLTVTAAIDGEGDDLVAEQSFYSSPMTAGRLTGEFREELQNGSLVIHAGVEVEQHALCFVSSNLFSMSDRQPVAYTPKRLILDPSMREIDLLFFGKIFRDAGVEGPYELRDLRVSCENLPYPPEWADSPAHREEVMQALANSTRESEPVRMLFEYNELSYTTRSYRLSDFSDQEWQSPAKDAKLAMYRQVAEERDDPSNEIVKKLLNGGSER
jgi:hypothetical protein